MRPGPAVLDAGAVGIRSRRFLGWMTETNQRRRRQACSDSAVVLAAALAPSEEHEQRGDAAAPKTGER